MQHSDGFIRQREPTRTYKFVIGTALRTTVCVEEPSAGSLSAMSGPSPIFPETEMEALAEARCLALACLAAWVYRRTSLLCIQFTLQLQ